MPTFAIGQRWISEAEPELGLGTLTLVDGRQIEIAFRATDERRRYAAAAAPLRRAQFKVGDHVASRDGTSFRVDHVEADGHLFLYRGEGQELTEDELSDTLAAAGPDERLRRGQVDAARVHALRTEGLEHLARLRGSPVRGFLGGRIDLIPHQLSIASDVASRQAPRVLLADEVGLGKTVEACLILHRQLLSGRVGRVLILVPESLVHQWFVELVRRFHLWFKLFDRERCEAIRSVEPDRNPFLEEQLVLGSIDFLLASAEDARAALKADWDMLVVDEAHRLTWTESEPSPGYRLVEALAARTPSVLLLSGTPEQSGESGHFARLRLLDPQRHSDLASFRRESEQFASVADVVDHLAEHRPVPAALRDPLLANDATGRLATRFAEIDAGDESGRERLITDLLDRHGTGRVLFRNTRAAVQGFPTRIPHLHPLEGARTDGDDDHGSYEGDPRLAWLLELLSDLDEEKVLLICRTRKRVEAVLASLQRRTSLKAAAFHEGLTLVQRDRNAAWFSEPDGARLLVSSEIGSEGRNFQFAHHLVLFDLPIDPEVLEQRIGRLDRIGQTGDVHIHVPYARNTPHELLALWHHEALQSFERSLRGGTEILEHVGSALHHCLEARTRAEPANEAEAALFADTRRVRDEIAKRLDRGRDRLLERTSLRPERADTVREAIAAEDEARTFERYLIRLLEHFGVEIDEVGDRTYRLGAEALYVDAIPGLPGAGLTVTFARQVALEREDLTFVTRDHALALGALELLLGSERGNSAFAVREAMRPEGLLLEAHFVLEAVAPPALGIDRFLPPTPLRVLLDQSGQPKSADTTELADLSSGRPDALLDRPEISGRLLPTLFTAAEAEATQALRTRVEAAKQAVTRELGRELDRLRHLQAVNDRVRDEEIDLATREIDELLRHLDEARLRLDTARLIWHGPRDFLEAD